MASTTETGHAKNVATFEDLESFCIGYGANYQPSKAAIKLAALATKRSDAIAALATINSTLPPWSNAVNARQQVFDPLSKLITRVVNAVAASDVTAEFVKDVKSIAKKIQGTRATDKKTPTPADPAAPVEESPKTISASQMSFDSRIENMNKLLELLTAEPNYIPNETDLKVASLTTVYTNMRTTNTNVIKTYTPLSNARIDRNNILYDATSGLVKVAADVKAYVKSVFGGTSPQYKQVSGLKFTTPKLK